MHLSHIFYRCMFILNQAKVSDHEITVYTSNPCEAKAQDSDFFFFKLSALYDVT